MSANDIQTMVAGQTASVSFTTFINTLHFDMVGVHATWSGCIADCNATMRMYASNNRTTWYPLDADPVSMVASQGSALWNLWSCPYHWVQFSYAAASNTTGSISVDAVKKARQ